MGQKITLQNLRAGNHSFGTDLHFGPGETKEVDLATLMKYGERGSLPVEIVRGEFKVINAGEKPTSFGLEVAPAKPAVKVEAPAPVNDVELAALLSTPAPVRKK